MTRNLAAERRNDAATVAHLEAELAAPHGGVYGPFAGSPDEAKAARIEREDEESLWAARLADSMATDGDEDDVARRHADKE